MTLNELSDDDLLARLHELCADARRLDARLILLLIEVEERRLDLTSACSSLFDFAVRRLGMSEGEAFRRITAARLIRRFPLLLANLESGRIHLTALVALRDHLTEANAEELVAAASGKTKWEIAELLARRAPRPDVPAKIRKIPSAVAARTSSPPAVMTAARIEPLSEARYRVQLTASVELRAKLERARDLMGHRNPSGDLAVVVERALDALLEKLEKERLGKTSRPPRERRPTKPGRIPQAVRRDVFERDGEQCTFADDQGRRCPASMRLEVDHVKARAQGGTDEAANLRVRCRAHNNLRAEEVFGRSHVRRRIDMRQRKSTHASSTNAAGELNGAAVRGLMNLGFREPEARRAVEFVAQRHELVRPIEDVVRDALGLLTSPGPITS